MIWPILSTQTPRDQWTSNLVVGKNKPTARMLENIGTELADELSVLVVDLDLMGGTTFSDNDVSRLTKDRHTVGIQELSVPFAAFTELKAKSSWKKKDRVLHGGQRAFQTDHSSRIFVCDDCWYQRRWCRLEHWRPLPMAQWIVLPGRRTHRISDDKSFFVVSAMNCSNATVRSFDGSSSNNRPSMLNHRPDRAQALVHSNSQFHYSSSTNWIEPVGRLSPGTIEMHWTITRTGASPSSLMIRRNWSAWESTRTDWCIYSCSSVVNCMRACQSRLTDDLMVMSIETICLDSTREAYFVIDDDYDCDKQWSRVVQ